MSGDVAAILLGYVCGALPFSYVAARLVAGIDLREYGSGNLGASNVYRCVGPGSAAVVLAADVLKGFLPVYAAPALGGGELLPVRELGLVVAFFAVIGHMFSVFVGFSGGKGIATTAGVLLALSPVVFAGALAVWLAVFFASRIVSLAGIVGVLVLPLLAYAASRAGLIAGGDSFRFLCIGIACIVLFKHRSNLRRLLVGEEPVLQRLKRQQ